MVTFDVSRNAPITVTVEPVKKVGVGGNTDLSNYYTKDEIAEQLDDYATEEYVGKKIAEAQLGGGEGGVDLSIYYTKIETDEAIQAAVDAVELLPGPQGVAGKDGYTPQKGVDYFDGDPGAPGEPGKDGYTPVKGVDYFDGSQGPAGPAGADGYTPVKGVDYFDGERGPAGETGSAGADGYTPVRGTDYWTDADKAEMVNAVLAALPVYNGEVG